MSEMMRRVLLFFLWAAGPLAAYFLLVKYFGLSDDYYFVPVITGLGIFIYFNQPLRWFGLPPAADVGVLIILGVIMTVFLASLIIEPMMEEEKALEICGSATFAGQCYRLPRAVCANMWEKYEAECSKEIKSDLGEKVTALIGPAVKKCTTRRFDKSLYYTRKSNNSNCVEFFKTIK